MTKRCLLLIPLLASTLSAGSAQAVGWEDVSFGFDGDYRFRIDYEGAVPAFETPPSATRTEELGLESGWTGEHRIRLEPKITLFDQVFLDFQIDVLSGLLFATTGDRDFLAFSYAPPKDLEGGDIDSFDLRRAWGEWKAPFGVLRLGRQPSQLGLGVLSNDGNGYDVAFGDKYLGDTSDRVAFGTKPISLVRGILSGEKPDVESDPFTIAFAYDWHVVWDEYYQPGDDVVQYIVVLLLEHAGNKVGFFTVRRDQEHDDDLVPPEFQPSSEFLKAWILDTYGELSASPDFLAGTEISLEWEFAWITGDTNLTVSALVQDPVKKVYFPTSEVDAMGWVLRLAGKRPGGELQFEAGYATGDGNRLDSYVHDFKFNPDFNVGLILFDDVLAGMYAAQTYNIVYQQGEKPRVAMLGANYLVSNGSVTNAVYVFPTLRVTPMENFQTILGVLWAQALQPLVDPYNDDFFPGSGGAGKINSFGGDASKKDYGWEVDLGVSYTIPTGFYDSRVVVGAEYGHFFPGNAFENGYGETIADIDKFRLRLTGLW